MPLSKPFVQMLSMKLNHLGKKTRCPLSVNWIILSQPDPLISPLIHHPVPRLFVHLCVCSSMGNMPRVISMYLISSGALRIWSLRPSAKPFGEKQTHPKRVYRSVPGSVCASFQDYSEDRSKDSLLKFLFASSLFPAESLWPMSDASNCIFVQTKEQINR